MNELNWLHFRALALLLLETFLPWTAKLPKQGALKGFRRKKKKKKKTQICFSVFLNSQGLSYSLRTSSYKETLTQPKGPKQQTMHIQLMESPSLFLAPQGQVGFNTTLSFPGPSPCRRDTDSQLGGNQREAVSTYASWVQGLNYMKSQSALSSVRSPCAFLTLCSIQGNHRIV